VISEFLRSGALAKEPNNYACVVEFDSFGTRHYASLRGESDVSVTFAANAGHIT